MVATPWQLTCDELVEAVDKANLVILIDNLQCGGGEKRLGSRGNRVWQGRDSVQLGSSPE